MRTCGTACRADFFSAPRADESGFDGASALLAKRLEGGRWLSVEAGLFNARHTGHKHHVRVISEGRDHVLVEFQGQRHAIPKRRGYFNDALPSAPPPSALRLRTANNESTLPIGDPTPGSSSGEGPG